MAGGVLSKKFLLKGGIIIIKKISWNEFGKRMKLVFGKDFKNVDELYFNVVKQINFGEGAEFEDLEVVIMLEKLNKLNGHLHVITDYCYENKCGPFVLDANEIETFVKSFRKIYKQSFYSTDVVIVNFEEKIIWVFFHEGICWLTKGKFNDGDSVKIFS